MNGNKCLADTSIVVHIFKKSKTHALKLESMDEVFINSVIIGELYFGAYASANILKKKNEVDDFIKKCSVLYISPATADFFGRIKAKLKAKGKPIPINDIWIAASALEHNLPIYTTDNHFDEIDGLVIMK